MLTSLPSPRCFHRQTAILSQPPANNTGTDITRDDNSVVLFSKGAHCTQCVHRFSDCTSDVAHPVKFISTFRRFQTDLAFINRVQFALTRKIILQCESKNPLRGPNIFHFSHKRLRIFNRFFTHLLHVLIYARLQIFIQLSPILTKLSHIKRDYPVHTICSKCPLSAETHAFRHFRKSLMALLIVVCGKSL